MFRASLFNQLGFLVDEVGMGKSILVVAFRLIGNTAFVRAGGEEKSVMRPKVDARKGLKFNLP